MDSAFIRETLQKQAPSAERILTEQPDYIRSSVVLQARQEDAPEQDIVSEINAGQVTARVRVLACSISSSTAIARRSRLPARN